MPETEPVRLAAADDYTIRFSIISVSLSFYMIISDQEPYLNSYCCLFAFPYWRLFLATIREE